MRFGTPDALWLLVLPLIAAALFVRAEIRRGRALGTYAHATLLPTLARGYAPGLLVARGTLFIVGLTLAAFAAARPQFGGRTELLKARGADVVIAIDASRSMLARDIRPSRLERAKVELAGLVDRLRGNRLALAVFAGEAFVQCPLTTDADALKLFLRAVDTRALAQGGTAVAAAISVGVTALDRGQQGQPTGRAMILLTDGEDHEGDLDGALKAAQTAGVKVHAVGVGSVTGEPIPDIDEEGNNLGYIRDANGATVMSRLNDGLLREIADKTGGVYVQSTDVDLGLGPITEEIAKLEKAEFEARVTTIYDEQYGWFLGAAIALWLLALAFPVSRAAKGLSHAQVATHHTAPEQTSRRPGTSATTMLAFLGAAVLTGGWTPFTRDDPEVEKGNEAAEAGDYEKAIEHYDAALRDNPGQPRIHHDKGIALYKKGDFNGARESFLRALDRTDDDFRADNFFNLGNANLKLGKIDEAIDNYRRALKAKPAHDPARNNLARALALKKQQEQQKKNQQQNGGPKDQDGDKPEPKDGENKQDQPTPNGQPNQPNDKPGQQPQPGQNPQEGDKPGEEGQKGDDAAKKDPSQGDPDKQGEPEKKGQQGQPAPDNQQAQNAPQPGSEQKQPADAAEAAQAGQPPEGQGLDQGASRRVLDALNAREGSLQRMPFAIRQGRAPGKGTGKTW